MPNLCTRGVYVILSHTHARSLAYINTHTPRTSGGGGGTLLGTLGRCAQTVLRPGFDHIFASAVALRPITVNKNPCLHVVNLIIFSLSSSLSFFLFHFSVYIYTHLSCSSRCTFKKYIVLYVLIHLRKSKQDVIL